MQQEIKTANPKKGCSTFVLRILRRDNGTWQGSLGHIQTGRMKTFQSCLEMIKILDETIDEGDND